MVAAMTHLPVLGVPVESKALKGQDSLLSIVQMPAGIPVGTLAIGEPGATNAGLLAAAILATSDPALAERLRAFPRRADRPRWPRPRATNDPPGSTIGILGGGQLGRMLAMAAAQLGYRCHVYSPERDSIAPKVSASSPAPTGTTTRRCPAFAQDCAGGHLRVRERAGGAAGGDPGARLAPGHRALEGGAGPAAREALRRELGGRPAAYAASSSEAELRAAIERVGTPASSRPGAKATTARASGA
jgi:hypothetical protein